MFITCLLFLAGDVRFELALRARTLRSAKCCPGSTPGLISHDGCCFIQLNYESIQLALVRYGRIRTGIFSLCIFGVHYRPQLQLMVAAAFLAKTQNGVHFLDMFL